MAKQSTGDVFPPTGASVELPSVYISGDYLDDILMVRSTSMSMTLNIGRLAPSESNTDKPNDEWEKVLVPFVAVHVDAVPFNSTEEPAEISSLFRKTLPLENAAFFLWDLSFELFESINDLGDIAAGKIPVEPERLKATAEILTGAKRKIDQSLASLREMGAIASET